MAGGRARVWAALVGDDYSYLLVRDDDIEPPVALTPEIRGEGLWAALECETPLEHWTVGLEAFAVELDDPFDAWRGELGTRVGLGFDLEWEATAPAAADGPTGFWQTSEVHGEVLVGPTERIDVVATGGRGRAWGEIGIPTPPAGPVIADVVVRHAAPLQRDGERVLYELWAGASGAGWRRSAALAPPAGL